jgi:XTP/dITP diphosphohydrolase
VKIVLATGNAGKLHEMRALLAGLSIDVVTQSEYNTPDAIENGLTFVENAIIKARNASAHCRLPALADDSGLEVDALNGAPGIFSARYSGEHGNHNDNNARLLRELEGLEWVRRGARFRCVMTFVRHPKDPSPIIAEGCWEGRILESADGRNGFGYDPLFFAPECGCSAAALTADEKNALSHRGKALRSMLEKLKNLDSAAGGTPPSRG